MMKQNIYIVCDDRIWGISVKSNIIPKKEEFIYIEGKGGEENFKVEDVVYYIKTSHKDVVWKGEANGILTRIEVYVS